MMNDKLTGRVRVRGGWFGKIVVQVEVLVPVKILRVSVGPDAMAHKWRDATVTDLSTLHNLTYSHIDVTVRLPDVPMLEPELLGEFPIKRGKLH